MKNGNAVIIRSRAAGNTVVMRRQQKRVLAAERKNTACRAQGFLPWRKDKNVPVSRN
jgi:hypothetical protein